MKTVNVEELTVESFLPFGFFTNMINPDTEKLGTPPIEFYRDMVQQDLAGAGIVSYSICRVEKRDLVVDNLSDFIVFYDNFHGEAFVWRNMRGYFQFKGDVFKLSCGVAIRVQLVIRISQSLFDLCGFIVKG